MSMECVVTLSSSFSLVLSAALVVIAGLAPVTFAAESTSNGLVRVGFVEGAYDEAIADGQEYRLLEADAEISVHLDTNAPTCLHMQLFVPNGSNSKQVVEVLGPGGVLARVDVGDTTLAKPADAYVDLSRFAPDPVRLKFDSELRVDLSADLRDVSFGIALPVRAVDQANCTTSLGPAAER
jgi:hypothetical protein